jgi:hypothetical protein
VLFLPLHDIAMNEGRVVTGPMMHLALFTTIFAGGVAAATRFRRSSLAPPAVAVTAGALGLVQGIWWGTGDILAAATSILLWLAAGARAFTLALRDWREPIGISFGVGSVVLLAEILLMGGYAEGASVLPVAVPVFFLGSLASRGASFQLSIRGATALDARRATQSSIGPRLGVGLIGFAALAAFMAAAIGLGGRHGGLVLLGRLILAAAIPILAFVLAPAIRLLVVGVAWLVDLLNIDLSPLRTLASRIDRFRANPPHATGTTAGPIGRVLALLFLLGLAYLLVRTIRLRWRWFEPREGTGPEPSEAAPMSIFAPRKRRRRARPTLELPADTVRRWYAEALLVLEALGLPKGASSTPGEYLRDVTGAFPECAAGFTALTRAYEDVRYGRMRYDRERLDRLEANRQLAMKALSRAHRLETEEEKP